jgi:hypothetical protein
MTSQPDMFTDWKPKERTIYRGEPPCVSHSETSKEAAKKIKPVTGELHNRIMDFLDDHPEGATDEQLIDLLGIAANTLRPRRRELQLAEKIKDSGLTRLTKSGRNATVWIKA